ncbi:MarR family transcriptional regulator [Halogeometricum borinquense]|uniref:MarR family transcriptional regulator n=1 Tax=Halogeometricum borinquense TaxID=60847 RepID=A0A482TP61_9EURY|nr:DUF6293 family protein [Halogeometricum borinquense]RYJ14685.1 MarR family transcriptional regulator [Halogeometricum borinquense]
MGETIHIIPVGFDFQRLVQPITQGNLEANRIHILHSSRESSDEEAQELAGRMVERLQETFETILGKTVNIETVDDIFKFEDAYPMAYDMIQEEVKAGNDVWVNISSMPRTVAFAFAIAANTLVVENPDNRDQIHTYYVSPEEYLVTRMIKELKKEREFLQDLDDNEEAKERFEEINDLVDDITRSGVTKGAKKMNGGLHVEFPAVSASELHKFEKTVLHFLDNVEKTESTSELARKLGDRLNEEVDDDSFKSKVQYNVKQLETKGFVDRTEEKNRYITELSTMGKLWVQTHRNDTPPRLKA